MEADSTPLLAAPVADSVTGPAEAPPAPAASSTARHSAETTLLTSSVAEPPPVAAPPATSLSAPPATSPAVPPATSPPAPPTARFPTPTAGVAPVETAAVGRPPAPAGLPPAEPYRFTLRRLTWIDKVIGLSSLALFVTLWVPWYSAGSGYVEINLNAINAHSYVAFALLTSIVLVAYLAARAGWDRLPMRLPIAHAPLLLVFVLLQLVIVVLGVISSPDGFDHAAGSWIGLVEALLATVAIGGPILQASQRR